MIQKEIGMKVFENAVRNAKQESLGFSLTELVFGHSVRGPLKVLKEQLVSGSLQKVNVLDFVSQN